MKGYKGFDKDLKCRDSKRVAKTINVLKELSLSELCQIGAKFIIDKVDFKDATTDTGYQSAATNTGNCSAVTNTGPQSAATNTGDFSAATNTGNCSAATNTGNCSAATNTGDFSAATNTGRYSASINTGYQSVATNTGNYSAAINTGGHSIATNTGQEGCAIALGINAKAKGALGGWLTLAEWKKDSNGDYHRVNVKTVKVDGKKIKPDVFYKLVDGKFMADKSITLLLGN